MRAQAEENLAKATAILDLYEGMKGRVADVTRSRYAIYTLDWLFEQPIFNSGNFTASAGIPDRTARRLLAALSDHGILRVMRPGNGRRGTILIFPDLLNIAEGRDVF